MAINRYKASLNNIFKGINHVNLTRITQEDIEKWRKTRKTHKVKNRLPFLQKPILLPLYNDFKDQVIKHLLLEETLNAHIGRVRNFPEYISENIVVHILKLKGRNVTWACKGDIELIENNKTVSGEVKCSYDGPSQFSPKTDKSDQTLFYIDARDHLFGNIKVYEFPMYMDELMKVSINKKQTLEEQQNGGRRPRFTICQIWKDKLDDKLLWEGCIQDLLS
jgi:hypothetical protein